MANKERLLKVADHLRNGVLGHKEFNFGVINAVVINGLTQEVSALLDSYSRFTEETIEDGIIPTCGTLGCAIGELPFIFPDDWKFNKKGMLCPSNQENIDHRALWEKVSEYFNIDEGTSTNFLFLPEEQSIYARPDLPDNATKEEVAANIEWYVKNIADSEGEIFEKNWDDEEGSE